MQVGCRRAPGTAQTGQSLAQLPTPQRAFQSGGRVLGGCRPSFQLLTRPRKNVPATFSRCCRFPKFILHTECCAAGQQSGATSHSSQTSLKTFTDAGFPAASFHSVGIVSMWVPSELEGGQLLSVRSAFLVSQPQACRRSRRLRILFSLQIKECCKVWIDFSNLMLFSLGNIPLLVIGLNCIYNTGSASFLQSPGYCFSR